MEVQKEKVLRIYVNSLRDEQVDVVWTLIGSGDLMRDTDEESEDEKIRSSVNVFFFWLNARGMLTCDFRP